MDVIKFANSTWPAKIAKIIITPKIPNVRYTNLKKYLFHAYGLCRLPYPLLIKYLCLMLHMSSSLSSYVQSLRHSMTSHSELLSNNNFGYVYLKKYIHMCISLLLINSLFFLSKWCVLQTWIQISFTFRKSRIHNMMKIKSNSYQWHF